jgi:long-chain acyl-CoA synthetase
MTPKAVPLLGHRAPTTSLRVGRTLIAWFWDNVQRHPERVALRYRDVGTWQALTWRAYGEAVGDVAAGLQSIGVEKGDRVALFSDNRPEWLVADLAIMSLGAATVPIYQTSAPPQVAHVLDNSGATVLIADSAERGRLAAALRSPTRDLRHIVVVDSTDVPDPPRDLTWHDLRQAGRNRRGVTGQTAPVDQTSGPDVATIVYTSGTTGPAKGVTLSHDNITFTVTSVASLVGVGPTDRMLSFLPLSHIAERVVSHFGQIFGGGETWFATDLSTIADDLRSCRPTIFFGVPRIWQKMHDAIVGGVGETGMRKRAFDRFTAVGNARIQAAKQHRVRVAASSLEWTILNATVGRAIRRRLGFDAARNLVSGAAPIDPALLSWFHSIGLPVGQVYGQTEDCGPATLATASMLRGCEERVGSVGRPIPGTDVRAADDGELLVRGPTVCVGYWRDIDATRALIDSERWMHTGDLGHVDADGWVWVTGRKKELIIGASGHNVAPVPIEIALCTEPLILNAVVVGDSRPYLTALITIDPDEFSSWATKHHRPPKTTLDTNDAELRVAVLAAIARVNAHLARTEQVRRFRILPAPLSIVADELTPTMKVKRAVVTARYADLIDQMYQADE